jgi:hypothetical protein
VEELASYMPLSPKSRLEADIEPDMILQKHFLQNTRLSCPEIVLQKRFILPDLFHMFHDIHYDIKIIKL